MSAYQQRFSCSPSLEYGVILTPVYSMAFPSCILFFYHIYHHLILLLIYVMVSHHYKMNLMRARNCVHFVPNLEQYQVSSQHSRNLGSLNEWMNWWMPSRDCDGSLWFWLETVLSLDSVIHDETVLALEAESRGHSGRGKQGAGVRRSKGSLSFVRDLCAQSLSRVRLFVTPWAVACQAPLSMGILQARILEWVAIPFFRGIFSTQGSKLCLLHLLHWPVDSLPLCCLVRPEPPFPHP